MRREGRQHGMVRSFCTIETAPSNPNIHARVINKLDSRATAGIFTKVSSKPTNHSKFTGRGGTCGAPKCSNCNMRPACKSKDKAKASQKLKSTTDVRVVCKYISRQLVDQKTTNGMKIGFEYLATGIVDRLGNYYDDRGDRDNVDDEYDI